MRLPLISTLRTMALGLLLALQISTHAYAQVDAATRATARSLFEEGVAFAEAGKWAEAADKFQRSVSLRPSPVVSFNLATALMELGRLVEASELLEALRRNPATTPPMKQRVDTSLETLRPQLAWLTVQLNGATEGAAAVLDGQPLPAAALGVPRAVDPGRRTLEVRVDGRAVWSRTLTVNVGQSETVAIDVPSEPATQAEPAVVAPTPEQTAAAAPSSQAPAANEHVTSDASESSSGPWLWVGIGGAVVVGTVVAVLIATSGGSEPAAPYMGTLGDGVIEVPAQ